MANRARGERSLKGKETYRLVFTSNAIGQAEGVLGYGVGRVMGNYMTGAFSIQETITLLWAGLLKHHGPLSIEDAGEILDEVLEKGRDVSAVFRALMECLNEALPFPEGTQNDPNAMKVGLRTGTRATSAESNGGTGSRAQPQKSA